MKRGGERRRKGRGGYGLEKTQIRREGSSRVVKEAIRWSGGEFVEGFRQTKRDRPKGKSGSFPAIRPGLTACCGMSKEL